MTDKQIIEKLKTDLDFERSKRKTLQEALKAKEQECERLKHDNGYEVGALERTIDNLKAENEELKTKNSILEDEYKILEDNLDSRTRDFEDVIDGYKQTLTEIKEIAETQQSWNEWNRQFSETESEDDIFAYNWSALKQILQKISECEANQ